MESIQEDQKKAHLIGPEEDITSLVEEYKGATPIQQAKVKYLAENYSKIRRIRRDGNCFIRAFAFGLFNYIHESANSKQLEDVKKFFQESCENLVKEGFSEYIEDFWEVLMEELQLIEKEVAENVLEEKRRQTISERLNNQSISDYVICYLRFIISGYLKRHEDEYQMFISDNCTVAEFCIREVEPMAVECDHIQIIGLTNSISPYLQHSIQIEYLDNSELEKTNSIPFPDSHPPFLYLLYRPGHYDILYK